MLGAPVPRSLEPEAVIVGTGSSQLSTASFVWCLPLLGGKANGRGSAMFAPESTVVFPMTVGCGLSQCWTR